MDSDSVQFIFNPLEVAKATLYLCHKELMFLTSELSLRRSNEQAHRCSAKITQRTFHKTYGYTGEVTSRLRHAEKPKNKPGIEAPSLPQYLDLLARDPWIP